jgi:hypothetical protein
VFRSGESLTSLEQWLAGEGIEREHEHLLPHVSFCSDKNAPRVVPEGGAIAFRWQDRRYRVLALRLASPRGSELVTWVAAPDRAAAEALVDAAARYARRKTSRVMVFEDGDWEEAPRLEEDLDRYTWDSLILPDASLQRIRRATQLFFQSEHLYRELGLPWKLGFLLVGPPGTGKTLTTKVLAATCDVPFLYVRSLNGFGDCGASPSTVRAMFAGARERGRCVLCLEDVDSLVTDELRSTFLNELDGLEEHFQGVLTVATTNHPERLDAALLHRPCRFDYRFEFPLPDDAQRGAFVAHWAERLARMGYVDKPEEAIREMVRRSQGMSHAYLKRVLIGTVMRMHTLEERGDVAFQRLALEELADAQGDQNTARRAVAGRADFGSRVGFRPE